MFSDKIIGAHPIHANILSWESAQKHCLGKNKYPSSISDIQHTLALDKYTRDTYWTGVTRMNFIMPLHGKHVYALMFIYIFSTSMFSFNCICFV